jgi:serine/threonine protein kinase, bacterial
MLKPLSHRALVAASALAFASACSSSSTPVSPGQATRILPGPVVTGSIVVPAVPRQSHLPRIWPAMKRRPILFVANLPDNEVEMYDPKTPNPSPEGSISDGLNYPVGVAVDKKGSLYVANEGNSTITIYPAGQSSPSLTISTGLDSNYGVTVDSNGDVFASNLGDDTVVGYKAGATSPFETIDFSNLGQPVGLAADSKNNLWVACDSTNAIYIVPAGSSKPQNSNFSDVAGPIGISFGKRDVTYVANFGANPSAVEIYTYGSKTPSGSITNGIEQNGPTFNAFTRSGIFFQVNQFDNVVGYKKGQTSPFSTITSISNPVGIASSPEIKE